MTRLATRAEGAVPGTISAYLQRIRRIDLLTPEDEIELGTKIRAGRRASAMLASGATCSEEDVLRLAALAGLPRCGALSAPSTDRRREILGAVEREASIARRRMIEANLRLVFPIIRYYSSRLRLPILELIQEGNIGLIRAVDGFDPSRGCRFATYGVWWIRQAVGSAVRRHLAAAGNSHGAGARRGGLAGVRSIDADEVWQYAHAHGAPEGSPFRGDWPPHPVAKDDPEELAVNSLVRRDVRAAVASLTSVERAVIETRYGLRDHRLRNRIETSRLLKLTYGRVRRIEAAALAKLREPMPGPSLIEYLA